MKQPPVSSARDRRIGARGVRLPRDPAAADAIGSSWPAGVLADPPTQPSSAEAVEPPGMKQSHLTTELDGLVTSHVLLC